MSLSYDVFSQAFLEKVTDFNFAQINTGLLSDIVDRYMKTACSQFRECVYDLLDRNDLERVIVADIPSDDVDEIVDIVSEGMVVQWLKPYFYKSENLENLLNTKDITSYSPAELLYRIAETYKLSKKEFERMRKEYSYNHGDLTDLHL